MRFKFLILGLCYLLWISSCSQVPTPTQEAPTTIPSPAAAPDLPTPSSLPAVTATGTAPAPGASAALLKLLVVNSEGTAIVHAGPGMYYPVVGKVSNNQPLDAVGIDASGAWIQFKDGQFPDGVAWIFTIYTTFDRSADTLPVITDLPTPPVTPTSPPPKVIGKIHVVNPDGPVNLRSGPDTVYPIIGQVKDGDTLNATGAIQSGDWVQVLISGPGGTAWIYTSFTDYDKTSGTLPVILDLPPTPTPGK